MCGRFTITAKAEEFQLRLGLGEMPDDWQPRYNVAPSQSVPVVIDADQRQVHWMQWGLVPFWAKTAAVGGKMINARAETVADKPAFRQSFAQRRCLILADGFYEWLKTGQRKGSSIPYYFHREDHSPFTFSGLWDQWTDADGKILQSCTIITCAANDTVLPIHARMPVILEDTKRWAWLTMIEPQDLQSLLVPVDEAFLTAYPVSRSVNNPNFDSEVCLQPERSQDSLF